MQAQPNETLSDLLSPYTEAVEADLRRWLPAPGTPGTLAEAMEYCVLGGGKRLRPVLVHMAREAAGGKRATELSRRSAVAVELVHCYSLVHDDLPSMDNDTLRRGRPTAHVRFGEAMAVLTGDALLTRAFAVLGEAGGGKSARVSAELARAAGPAGMIAGQVGDMGLCDLPDGEEGLQFIHMHKTAALIRAAARIGAVCAGAPAETLAPLSRYGEALGLAFQLFDDMLDVTASAEQLGKTPGKDAQAGKETHISRLGADRARQRGQELTATAVEALEPLGQGAARLVALAEAMAARTS